MNGYASQLSKVANQVGMVVRPFDPRNFSNAPTIAQLLHGYAEVLRPWAVETARNMIEEVNQRDETDWRRMAQEMSRGLRTDLRSAPIGGVIRDLLADQVDLIQSIPRQAAERVHRLALEGMSDSTRAASIAEEIMRSGEVAKSRAILIARTEVSRAAETLTQARAEHIGSPGYLWRTSEDKDVRPSHREMDGVYVRWGSPPTLDGLTGHAGCLPNCRCYAEPVIPD